MVKDMKIYEKLGLIQKVKKKNTRKYIQLEYVTG